MKSSERHPGSPRLAKFREKPEHLKQLAIIAHDNRGILSTDFAPIGETVNGTCYAEFLRTKLRQAIQKKRLALLQRCCADY